MAANYSIIEEVEPAFLLNKPDLLVGNFDNTLRGFLETHGRVAQPAYNILVCIHYSNITCSLSNKIFNNNLLQRFYSLYTIQNNVFTK